MAPFRGIEYGRKVEILPGIAVRFGNAGHILGAAVVELWLTENGNTKKIAGSGRRSGGRVLHHLKHTSGAPSATS